MEFKFVSVYSSKANRAKMAARICLLSKGEKYQLKKLHVKTSCTYENAQNKIIFVTLVWFYLCFYMDISAEKVSCMEHCFVCNLEF